MPKAPFRNGPEASQLRRPSTSPGDHHQDPFPNDTPLFRIDGSNYNDYADKLSVGQMATFEKYPDSYFMDVYPSRRSTSFPEHIYEMTAENGKTAELAENGEGVVDAAEGFPSPSRKMPTS